MMTGTPETIKQLVEGYDFEPPGRLISDLTAEQATVRREGWPYSIAGVVAHALYWQQLWLDGIFGRPNAHKRGSKADWPHVSGEEWDSVRSRFLAGMDEARLKAEDTADLGRKLKYGMTVEQTLLRVAVHNSYHVGQIALLRQLLGSWPPAGGDDAW